jgi:beta-phosphoglucomutase-like phosphatase (HAD superfamily)
LAFFAFCIVPHKPKLHFPISPNRNTLNHDIPQLFIKFIKYHRKENNIPVTIATSSEITNPRFFIKEFDLKKWLDISKIIFDDGTFKGKPEPDIYIKAAKAAKAIGIPIEECLVFEDAVSGITSARKAVIGKIIRCNRSNKRLFSISSNIGGIGDVGRKTFRAEQVIQKYRKI